MILFSYPELDACRQALEAQNFKIELDSGAKVLVQPQHYEAAVEAIRIRDVRLFPEHVIVDPELYSLVLDLVMGLPKREKIYSRGSEVVPLGLTLAAKNAEQEISV